MKTDGKNLYSYSEESREVRIVQSSTLNLLSTIKLPETFSSVTLYLSKGKLVLVGTKYTYSGNNWNYRWYAPESKSIVAVYNVSTPEKPILERYSQIDGNYRESRLIGDMLYMVSSSYLRMPPVYSTLYAKKTTGFDDSINAIGKDFSLKNISPEIRESIRTNKGKVLQSIRSSVANCKDVTFVLPDDETLKSIDFSPTFVSLSSVNISDPTSKMKSELLFGDVSQIHMSQSALYITSAVSVSGNSTSPCPINAECAMPAYSSTISKTLVHKYALA